MATTLRPADTFGRSPVHQPDQSIAMGMSRAELLDVITVLERGRVRILAQRADQPDMCDREVHGIVDALREPGIDQKVGRVRRAYERLIDGTFNTCTGCGNTIGYQRLRLIPQSESCVPCAILAGTD